MSDNTDHPTDPSKARKAKLAAYAHRPKLTESSNPQPTKQSADVQIDRDQIRRIHQETITQSEKPKRKRGEKQKLGYTERGGCLSTWLGLIIIANVAMGVFNVGVIYQAQKTPELTVTVFAYVLTIMQFAVALFAYALWNWKSWGFIGLVVAYLMAIGLGFLNQGLSPSIVSGVIGLSLLLYLLRDKKEYLS